MTDVSKSRSAITNMFESKGPKMTFGGSLQAEKTVETKAAAKKKENSDMNERKWVFDTIQKYFDVIVEEEKEEENEEEDGVDGDEEDDNESDSDYTDAEDEIPEID